jgi:hypothetical protein
VTRSPEARRALLLALNGIETLLNVTGEHNLLARCVVRPESPCASGPRSEEKRHGDRALRGPDSRRDAETTELIAAWLQRSKRDAWVDLRGRSAGSTTSW